MKNKKNQAKILRHRWQLSQCGNNLLNMTNGSDFLIPNRNLTVAETRKGRCREIINYFAFCGNNAEKNPARKIEICQGRQEKERENTS